MKILWMDTETTGLDSHNDKIVEIACFYEDTDNGDKDDVFHEYIKYDKYPYNYKVASDITGLTPEILKKKGSVERIIYDKYITFLDSKVDKFDKQDKMILAGYHIGFDDEFSRKMFDTFLNNYYGSYFFSCRIDVMTMVAMALRYKIIDLLPNYKLETVANALQIKFKSHSAPDDIKATRKIYSYLEEQFKCQQ